MLEGEKVKIELEKVNDVFFLINLFKSIAFSKDSHQILNKGQTLYPVLRNNGQSLGRLPIKRKRQEKPEVEGQKIFIVEDLVIKAVLGLSFSSFPKMLVKKPLKDELFWIKFDESEHTDLFIQTLHESVFETGRLFF